MPKYKEIAINVNIRPEAILGSIIRDTLKQQEKKEPDKAVK